MSENEVHLPVPSHRPKRWVFLRNPWLIVVLLALGLSFWQWYETRSRLARTEQNLAQSLKKLEGVASSTNLQALSVGEQAQVLAARVHALETNMAEFQGQTEALQILYQELSKSRDDASLLEIEQSVNLAAQQLQLAGNVQTAVLALQTADAKLAVLNRPQFNALRKALGRDLERLRALPLADLTGISLKLENMVTLIDEMPLAMDGRPPLAAKSVASTTGEIPWWERVSSQIWQEIKGLVRIQRFDRAEPVLLAPGQSFFLRDNLKLRLLNARLALLSHDQWIFRKDLKTAQDWLERHFDGRDKRVLAAQATLKQLSSTDINIELPNLNESLSALRMLRSKKEKK